MRNVEVSASRYNDPALQSLPFLDGPAWVASISRQVLDRASTYNDVLHQALCLLLTSSLGPDQPEVDNVVHNRTKHIGIPSTKLYKF